MFSAGLDLQDMMLNGGGDGTVTASSTASSGVSTSDVGRKGLRQYLHIRPLQDSFTSIEKCLKPVIVCVHSACIGGGQCRLFYSLPSIHLFCCCARSFSSILPALHLVDRSLYYIALVCSIPYLIVSSFLILVGMDLISACDIRFCSQDAKFCIKEVDVGLAADVGTLQRLPKIIGNDSLIRELTYTARNMLADEALRCGLVSRVYENRATMVKEAMNVAKQIAEKSPIAISGSKHNLVYARDHTVDDGLNYVATWNAMMLQSEDVPKAAMAFLTKKRPVFSKL